ncbi:MAG: hypothetical protein UU07_C0047G0012 [Parcubacteria group bacterium GW2011_GWF1_40_5]|nr:MAG: hypothetical protein UU07_C0047G0012 [Parcubacteria group bacterium GW2011_GWF1_40_5]
MQATHLILDFHNDIFSLEEKRIQEPNKNLTSFFKFREEEKFLLEEMVQFGIFTIQSIHDLALRGFITQKAKEKIKELLVKSPRGKKCI